MVMTFDRLWSQFRAWWRRIRRRDSFAGVQFIDQSANPCRAIRRHWLVLVGAAERPKWLRFACPCRCGEVIALNLMTSHHPHWAVQLHDDQTLTVQPSVDATRCGSHFWIRRSRIEWV